jgi:hypothetical protein
MLEHHSKQRKDDTRRVVDAVSEPNRRISDDA